jgi:hypothetical protein
LVIFTLAWKPPCHCPVIEYVTVQAPLPGDGEVDAEGDTDRDGDAEGDAEGDADGDVERDGDVDTGGGDDGIVDVSP